MSIKKQLKEKNSSELILERDKIRKEYSDLKFKKVLGVLENPLKLRTLRRNIARINTLLHLEKIDKIRNKIGDVE